MALSHGVCGEDFVSRMFFRRIAMIDVTQVSLLERLQRRSDQRAWEIFDVTYRKAIESFLRGRGLDVHDAADVCQDVMVVVYRQLPRFRHNGRHGAFRSWLRKVTATTLARSRRRRTRVDSRVRLSQIVQQLADDKSQLSRIWNYEHDQAIVERLMSLLSERVNYRSLTVFRRTFLEGISADQVAEELGMTKNAVVVAKSKTLKQARRLGRSLVNA